MPFPKCLNLRAGLAAGAFAVFLAAGMIPASTARAGAVNRPIQYTDQEKPYIAGAFDSFIQLVEKRELPAGTLSYPAHLARMDDGTIVVAQSFYVSPDEIRGFELIIPKDALHERDAVLFQKEPLVIENENAGQNIRRLVLRKKTRWWTAASGQSAKQKGQ
ncbi:MAG: hypothetical protein LBC18_10390 [Opitutaceae bacterium]|jgi:hypothetical protein|nr:hypothetical protein [Opitutaceae bacterium]